MGTEDGSQTGRSLCLAGPSRPGRLERSRMPRGLHRQRRDKRRFVMKGCRTFLVVAIAVVGVLSLRGDTQRPRDKPRVIDSAYLPQLVFYAVLEGLYEDGVSTDDVNRILAVDPRTQQPQF